MDTLLMAHEVLRQHMIYIPPNAWALGAEERGSGVGRMEANNSNKCIASQRNLPTQRVYRTILPDAEKAMERVRDYLNRLEKKENDMTLHRKQSSMLSRMGMSVTAPLSGNSEPNMTGGSLAMPPAMLSVSNRDTSVTYRQPTGGPMVGGNSHVVYGSSDPLLPGGGAFPAGMTTTTSQLFSSVPNPELLAMHEDSPGYHRLALPLDPPSITFSSSTAEGGPLTTDAEGNPVDTSTVKLPKQMNGETLSTLIGSVPSHRELKAAVEIVYSSRETYTIPNPNLDELIPIFYTHMGTLDQCDTGFKALRAIRALEDFLCIAEGDAKDIFDLLIRCGAITNASLVGASGGPGLQASPAGSPSPQRPGRNQGPSPARGAMGSPQTQTKFNNGASQQHVTYAWDTSQKFQLNHGGITEDRASVGWHFFLQRYVAIESEGSEFEATPGFYYSNFRAISLHVHKLLASLIDANLQPGKAPKSSTLTPISPLPHGMAQISDARETSGKGSAVSGRLGVVHTLDSAKVCISVLCQNNFPCSSEKDLMSKDQLQQRPANFVPQYKLWLIIGAPRHLQDHFVREGVQDILAAIELRYGPRDHLAAQCSDGFQFRKMVQTIGREISQMSQQLFWDRPSRLSGTCTTSCVRNIRAVASDLSKHTIARIMKILSQFRGYFDDYFDDGDQEDAEQSDKISTNGRNRRAKLALEFSSAENDRLNQLFSESTSQAVVSTPTRADPSQQKGKGTPTDENSPGPSSPPQIVTGGITSPFPTMNGAVVEPRVEKEAVDKINRLISSGLVSMECLDCISSLSPSTKFDFLRGLSILSRSPLGVVMTYSGDDLLFTDLPAEITRVLTNWAAKPTSTGSALDSAAQLFGGTAPLHYDSLAGAGLSAAERRERSASVSQHNGTPTISTPTTMEPKQHLDSSSREGSPVQVQPSAAMPGARSESDPQRFTGPRDPVPQPYQQLPIIGKSLSGLRSTVNDPWRRSIIPIGGQPIQHQRTEAGGTCSLTESSVFGRTETEIYQILEARRKETARAVRRNKNRETEGDSEKTVNSAAQETQQRLTAEQFLAPTVVGERGGLFSGLSIPSLSRTSADRVWCEAEVTHNGGEIEETESGAFTSIEAIYLTEEQCKALRHHIQRVQRSPRTTTPSAVDGAEKGIPMKAGWYYAAKFGISRVTIITLLSTCPVNDNNSMNCREGVVAQDMVCPVDRIQKDLSRLESLIRIVADDLSVELFALQRSVVLRDRVIKPLASDVASMSNQSSTAAGPGGVHAVSHSLLYAEVDKYQETVRFVRPDGPLGNSTTAWTGGNLSGGNTLTGQALFTHTAFSRRVEDVLSLANKPLMPVAPQERSFPWQEEKPSRVLLKTGLFREHDTTDRMPNSLTRKGPAVVANTLAEGQGTAGVFGVADGGIVVERRVLPATPSVVAAFSNSARVQVFAKTDSSDIGGAENTLLRFSSDFRTKRAEGVSVSPLNSANSLVGGGASGRSTPSPGRAAPKKKGFFRR